MDAFLRKAGRGVPSVSHLQGSAGACFEIHGEERQGKGNDVAYHLRSHWQIYHYERGKQGIHHTHLALYSETYSIFTLQIWKRVVYNREAYGVDASWVIEKREGKHHHWTLHMWIADQNASHDFPPGHVSTQPWSKTYARTGADTTQMKTMSVTRDKLLATAESFVSTFCSIDLEASLAIWSPTCVQHIWFSSFEEE
jgi:hypothetical protein